MQKLKVFETKQHTIITAFVTSQEQRVLKVSVHDDELQITDDHVSYTTAQMQDLLLMIHSGNKTSGGLQTVLSDAFGLLGFVRFNQDFHYMYVITKASVVCEIIPQQPIYRVDQVKLVRIVNTSQLGVLDAPASVQEAIEMFSSVDLRKNCYFSYSYDLTQTLSNQSLPSRDMYIWNYNLTRQADIDWYTSIIYGYLEANCVSPPIGIQLILVARRSRHMAGVRYLRRGISMTGSHVANEVESEQIVICNARRSSFVQLRGSIPLRWSQHSQDTTPLAIKPPIVTYSDPFYVRTARHFRRLYEEFGSVVVVNLIKATDRRESTLLSAYTAAIEYLNMFVHLPIRYICFDMANELKQQNQNVILKLEQIAEEAMPIIGFSLLDQRAQSGILRTNCIDCLDRTNAAQFIFGKVALGYQLEAMNLVANRLQLTLNVQIVKLLMAMYQNMGDIIALQYGGSALVNTMETYRIRNKTGQQQLSTAAIDAEEEEGGGMGQLLNVHQYISQSRDMIESLKRYYSNSFTDAEKQDAINLFLHGNSRFHWTSDDMSFFTSKLSLTLWLQSQHSQIDIKEKLQSHFNATQQGYVSFQDFFMYNLMEQASQEGRSGLASPFCDYTNVILQAPPGRQLDRLSEEEILQAEIVYHPDSGIKDLSAQEITEYERYVAQFSSNICESETDLYNEGYYEKYLQMQFKVDPKDLQMYENHVAYKQNGGVTRQVDYQFYKRWLTL